MALMNKVQGRLRDRATGGDAGPGKVPAITGSDNVLVNGRPALRVTDKGETWTATKGATHVLINGKQAFRREDPTVGGQLVEGSDNVLVGDG
ncbi:Hypothetical protein A7982_04024 [Minicystis rosea]|nr:Hypothetical protein A7982_04024 [Minicystis rosea]